jgi:hypothetical protein
MLPPVPRWSAHEVMTSNVGAFPSRVKSNMKSHAIFTLMHTVYTRYICCTPGICFIIQRAGGDVVCGRLTTAHELSAHRRSGTDRAPRGNLVITRSMQSSFASAWQATPARLAERDLGMGNTHMPPTPARAWWATCLIP